MDEVKLFLDKSGNWVTNKSLLETLFSIEADKCDTLFIHTALSFGIPNPQLKKKELLDGLINVIRMLGVRNICMPTFTFSFCNGLDYNPATSVSKMGVLNEFFRKQEGVIRSNDPLMSVALLGEDKELVTNVGCMSCGENSTYDKLRHRNNVKFLFLGPKIGECMTYMHYLEWLYSVDYRYNRIFRGRVTINNKTYNEEYSLFVRYNGVTPSDATFKYEQMMYANGTARIVQCGDGTISIVDEKNASMEYKKCLDVDRYFFVNLNDGRLVQDKTFIIDHEMVAM